MEIKNIVAFCALMQGNDGILNKSPGYIMEKFQRYCQDTTGEAYRYGLDRKNAKVLDEWCKKWFSEDE